MGERIKGRAKRWRFEPLGVEALRVSSGCAAGLPSGSHQMALAAAAWGPAQVRLLSRMPLAQGRCAGPGSWPGSDQGETRVSPGAIRPRPGSCLLTCARGIRFGLASDRCFPWQSGFDIFLIFCLARFSLSEWDISVGQDKDCVTVTRCSCFRH